MITPPGLKTLLIFNHRVILLIYTGSRKCTVICHDLGILTVFFFSDNNLVRCGYTIFHSGKIVSLTLDSHEMKFITYGVPSPVLFPGILFVYLIHSHHVRLFMHI
jgi:hypothetical protein